MAYRFKIFHLKQGGGLNSTADEGDTSPAVSLYSVDANNQETLLWNYSYGTYTYSYNNRSFNSVWQTTINPTNFNMRGGNLVGEIKNLGANNQLQEGTYLSNGNLAPGTYTLTNSVYRIPAVGGTLYEPNCVIDVDDDLTTHISCAGYDLVGSGSVGGVCFSDFDAAGNALGILYVFEGVDSNATSTQYKIMVDDEDVQGISIFDYTRVYDGSSHRLRLMKTEDTPVDENSEWEEVSNVLWTFYNDNEVQETYNSYFINNIWTNPASFTDVCSYDLVTASIYNGSDYSVKSELNSFVISPRPVTITIL